MSQNSLFAYRESERTTGEKRRIAVYRYMLVQGDEGATDDEMIHTLGIKHASMAGTRLQLMRLGAVVKTTKRRKTAAGNPADVYVAIPGINVRKAPPKTERDHMLTAARKKIKEMSDDELRAFLAEGSDEHEAPDDLLDFYAEFRD